MVAGPIVDSVRKYLRAVQEQGIAVRYGVVFGSRSTGGSSALSDIDLIVVSPRFDGPRDRRDLDLMWRVAARTDSRIEPIACGEKQFQEDDSSAIVEMARRHGERIDL